MLVRVDYQELPVVVDAVAALRAGAPQVHANAPDNRAFHWEIGDKARTEAALRGAAKVVRTRLVNQRLIANAIEPRASLASYQPATDELTLWVTSQNPHVHRLIMGAFVLGIPEQNFRVIAPDVGGGFGSKIFVYPEEVAVAWLARKLGVPVKWTAQRSESFLSDAQGRDHVSDVEMAFDASGKVAGLRVSTVANLGAYLTLFAPAVPTYLYGTLLNGLYDFPAIHCEVDGVFTHTVPVDAYRGAGRPEACYLLERTMDIAARELGTDPAELRRKNLIPKERFPFQTQVALTYDSGNYAPALARALERVGYERFRAEQAEARKKGRYLGLGLSCYIEACGIAPSQVVGSLGAQAGLYESATVRIHPTGKVTVLTGSHSHGQGPETTFAQLVADILGIPMTDVDIVHGDTGRIPFGMGTYGSRSGAVGGAAIHLSLQKIIDKGRALAAFLLEAAPDDVEFKGGRFSVKGSPDRGKTFAEVSLAAYLAPKMPSGREPGLEATSSAPSASMTAGRSADGSAWARLPPMVPMFRTWASPICAAASDRMGSRSRTSGECSRTWWGVAAPMIRAPPSSRTPDSPGTRRMSTRWRGSASRSFISGRSECPPARSLADSPKRPRSATASSTLPARWYSNGTGYMATSSPRTGPTALPSTPSAE